MINLLPPSGFTALQKEYTFRMAATYGLLLASVAILLTVALIPTYVLVRAQMNGAIAHDAETKESADIAELESDVARTEATLAVLKKQPKVSTMSTFVHAVEASAPSGISFKTFSVGYEKNTLTALTLQGTAQRREDLIAFKRALEAQPVFISATIPISDLAREQNISFSMTIGLAPSQP